MGADSAIEWCDHTFNPWWGCKEVSSGCAKCYAKKRGARFGVGWGALPPRRTFGEKHWAEPLAWDRAAARAGVQARVFCASMGDVFEDHPTCEAERMKLWALIRATPNLMWLLLTKRPENIMPSLDAALALAREAGGASEPGYHVARMLHLWVNGVAPKNVALGASIENQAAADARIPALLGCPAAFHFLSMEPLLGEVKLRALNLSPSKWSLQSEVWKYLDALTGVTTYYVHCQKTETTGAKIDWVIVGGESGPGARPMHPDWARSLRDQCVAAGVPFFFKQWGEWEPYRGLPGGDIPSLTRTGKVKIVHPSGRDTFEISEATGGLNTENGSLYMARVGKRTAGRLLDGREWNEMPGRERGLEAPATLGVEL